MSGPINEAYSLTDTEEMIFFVDRWGFPNFTITEDLGTDEAIFDGTLQRINLGETPTWHTLRDISTGADTDALSGEMAVTDIGPLEAIRVRVVLQTGTIAGRIMQSGAP